MVKRGYIQSVWHRAWHLAAFNTFAAISINLSLNCIPVPCAVYQGVGRRVSTFTGVGAHGAIVSSVLLE